MALKRSKIGMHSAHHVGPNMTPMVDVVMVILIFFMLGSSFTSPVWYLTNNTPAIRGGFSDVKTSKFPPVKLIIKLDRRGNHTMATIGSFQTENLKGSLFKWLNKRRKILGKKTQLIIKPHESVPYQDVITVYSDCVRARYHEVAFGMPTR